MVAFLIKFANGWFESRTYLRGKHSEKLRFVNMEKIVLKTFSPPPKSGSTHSFSTSLQKNYWSIGPSFNVVPSRCSGLHSGVQIKPLWYQIDDNDWTSQMPQLSINLWMSDRNCHICVIMSVWTCHSLSILPTDTFISSSRHYWSYYLGINKHLRIYNAQKEF